MKYIEEVMELKSVKYVLIFLTVLASMVLIVLFVSSYCADKPSKESQNDDEISMMYIIKTPIYPGPYKTIEINNIEYMQARGDAGKYGGTLRASTIGQGPKTFNPWVSNDATSSEMSSLMFDSLLMTDAFTGEVVPQMAVEFSVSDDNTEYTLRLRKGLIWSDGRPITSEDVRFTWEEIIAKGFGNPSSRDNLLVEGRFPEIEVIDRYTVKFKTSKPFAPFLRMMGGIQVAPKHILEPVVKKGETAFSSFWGADSDPKSFVVSGKFILDQYHPGQRVEFVRNPYFYMIDKDGNHLPYLDRYVIFIVGSIDTDILKFNAGEIDITNIPGNDVVTMKERESKAGSDFTIYNLGPNTSTTFLVFNLNNRINKKTGEYYVDPVKQKWFQDLNFRKAIDWAIDRKNIVNNVVQGVGAPLFTAESLSSIYLNEKLAQGHPRDLDKAKQYLKKSGFKIKNGKLYDRDNKRVEFNLLTNAGNTEREAIGVIIKEDLEKLGVKVNFKPIEFNALVGKVSNSLDWEAVIIGLTGSQLEPHSGRNVWNSDGALHMFNQRKKENDLESSDTLLPFEKELDRLFEEGASHLDFEKRKEIYNEYQRVIYDNLPMIYLYSPLRIVAVRNRLGNIKPTILGGVQYNIEEIYIKDPEK
jgi:peptide/nickel transport system substrate-binding protein